MWLFLFVNFYVASSWCGEMGNNLFRKLFLSLTSSSFLSSNSVGMHECYFRKCVAYMMMVIIHDCWWCYFLLISSDFFIFFSHFIYYILLRWSKIEMKGMVLWHLRFLRPTHKSFLWKNYSIKFCRHWRKEFCWERNDEKLDLHWLVAFCFILLLFIAVMRFIFLNKMR